MKKSTSPISTKESSSKRKVSIDVPFNSKPEDETKAEVSNEKPNKKIIKLSELTNMDPLDYFSRFLDISEMILHQLSGQDLIEISEVHPSWYNFIASTKILMEKLKIVFEREFEVNGGVKAPDYNKKIDFRSAALPEDYNLLKNSPRLYQNINIQRRVRIWTTNRGDENNIISPSMLFHYVTDSELDVFYSKGRGLRDVSVSHVYFKRKLDLWRLLSAIESSLESIFVVDHGLRSFEDPSSEIESFEALKFPKLKKLKVHFYGSSFADTLARFLINSVAVEELDLLDYSGTVGKDILTKMLEKFDNLKIFRLESLITNQIFDDDAWKKFNFKLKYLSINIKRHGVFSTNFRNFLKSQSDCLEELAIEGEDIDRETFDAIMKMSKLKILTFRRSSVDFSNSQVQKKTSITELNLHRYASAASIKFLLESMPKVIDLRLHTINAEILEILTSMKRKFEKLRVYKLEGVKIKEMHEIMTENCVCYYELFR